METYVLIKGGHPIYASYFLYRNNVYTQGFKSITRDRRHEECGEDLTMEKCSVNLNFVADIGINIM